MCCANFIREALCGIPVYMVLALVATDWYTFVIVLSTSKNGQNKCFSAHCVCTSEMYQDNPYSARALFHWVMVSVFIVVVPLLVVSYIRAWCTNTTVEDNPPHLGDIMDDGEDTSPLAPSRDTARGDSENPGPAVPRCRKCLGPKPARAHHCSICGKCVLKMDHHCQFLRIYCHGLS